MIVGNKSDLSNDREVDAAKGEEYAHKKECLFIEASAKTGDGVDDAFEETIQNAVQRLIEAGELKQKDEGVVKLGKGPKKSKRR
eukprot:CAMPEP_0174253754 /NCGR_PEP_ID=MMETSP0439-20130205/3101_1 /TAXON_ID=0 /ORGANISM="Stereomyxa ramosa, Strain Chinc5" /LENGTH=83 /DNA_ID=CAMNT_0015334937 /DNA_START=389 /DNA_END=636 /DNA_ORIENTATION=+